MTRIPMIINVKKRKIGENNPVFIIAEAGINHNGNVKLAKKMISVAKKSGVDAIKFQTFKASDLASPSSPYFKIFKKNELEDEEFGEISDYAREKEIIFFSTPVSEDAVDLLIKLRVPLFKISSGDLTHLPLLRHVASKKKPIIISTGMSNLREINNAVKTINSKSNKKIMILHSVSAYPTPMNEVNLNSIQLLKERFPYPIGYSDNGEGNLVSLTAVAVGAKIIEKHFTLSKKMIGPDHSFSSDPKELEDLVKKIKQTEKILGKKEKNYQPSEKKIRVLARRSIITKTMIPKGTKISKKMLSIRRPATGIAPSNLSKVIGNFTIKKINSNQPLKWSYLKSKRI